MNEQNLPPKSIAEVEALAAKVGIALTPADYAAAQALADQRRQQVEREMEQVEQSRSKTAAWVDQFNRWYPKFLKSLHAIGDVFLTLAHTVMIAFGVPVVLLFCMIVEHTRVYHGVKLFDATESAAWLGAFVIVVANLLIELLISWREHQTGWQAPPRYDFSFRLLAIRLRYMFGGATDWQPAAKSPAQRFRIMLRIVTASILVLALAGSMQPALQRAGGDWLAAIGQIIAHSTLPEMLEWLCGLLFAFCIVTVAQGLSHFTAERVIEVAAVLQSSGTDRDVRALEAAGLTAAAALLARLKEHQKARRSGLAMASAMDMPEVGTGGTIRVPDLPAAAPEENLTKVATAIGMLARDKSLYKLSNRALEAKTGIGRNTWSLAKRRSRG